MSAWGSGSVPLQEGGQAQGLADGRGERHVVELGAHVGRLDDDATERVHGPGAGNANAGQGLGQLGRGAGSGGLEGIRAGPNDRLRPVLDRCSTPGVHDAGPIVDHDGRANVRTAYVERENRPG